MAEEQKLAEVVGLDAVKEQLQDFVQYKQAVETLIKEMATTLENISERVSALESTEGISEELKAELSKIDDISGKINEIRTEMIEKVDKVTDENKNISLALNDMKSNIDKTKGEVDTLGKKLEDVENKSNQAIVFKNKVAEFLKYLSS